MYIYQFKAHGAAYSKPRRWRVIRNAARPSKWVTMIQASK
jgi:hypothetical protein